MNLLDLDGRPQRRQGFYWASVIVSIVVHSGFLVYLLTYARLPGEQAARPRSPDVNVEVIGPTRYAALPRGDREDVIIEAPSEDARPPARADEEAVEPAPVHINAEELASQIGTPLPEDGAKAAKPLPLPDRLPERRIGTSPVLAGRAPPIATPRTETRMSLPARRMSQMAAEARLSERPVPDPQPGDRRPPPNAIPLPPAKVPAAPEQAHPAPGSEESHASTLDMGTQGDPVVAVLPKEAGVAMFGARIIDGAPMLPEDRPAPPAPMPPGQSRRPRRARRAVRFRLRGGAPRAFPPPGTPRPNTAIRKAPRTRARAAQGRRRRERIRAMCARIWPRTGPPAPMVPAEPWSHSTCRLRVACAPRGSSNQAETRPWIRASCSRSIAPRPSRSRLRASSRRNCVSSSPSSSADHWWQFGRSGLAF